MAVAGLDILSFLAMFFSGSGAICISGSIRDFRCDWNLQIHLPGLSVCIGTWQCTYYESADGYDQW